MRAASHPQPNLYEPLGQHRKALRLGDLFDALHVAPALLGKLSDGDLKRFARLAGVERPGTETQTLTVEMLKARHVARIRVAQCVLNAPIEKGVSVS